MRKRYRCMSTTGTKEAIMQKDTAYEAVCNAFGHYFEVHPRQVLAHHDLRRDWGLDPVELELLVAQIEERVGVELTEAIPLAEVTTISQLVRAVRAQLRRAAHPAPLREVG